MGFSMDVKINKVRDEKTGKVVTVDDCENGCDREYICIIDNCADLMIFNKMYEQRRIEKY